MQLPAKHQLLLVWQQHYKGPVEGLTWLWTTPIPEAQMGLTHRSGSWGEQVTLSWPISIFRTLTMVTGTRKSLEPKLVK